MATLSKLTRLMYSPMLMMTTSPSQFKPHKDKLTPFLPAALLHTTSIKDFTNQAKRKYNEFFLSKIAIVNTIPVPTYAKNDDRGEYLHHRWNKSKSNRNKASSTTKLTTTPHIITTPSYQTAFAPIKPAKDDPIVTPTLETLCTLDTCSSDPTYHKTGAILNITIWNQQINNTVPNADPAFCLPP